MVKSKIKYIVIGLVIVIIIIIATQTRSILQKYQDVANGNECGISLTNKNRIFEAETSNRFHGDGVRYKVYRFEKVDIELIISKIKKNNKWKSCPFDNAFADIVERYINNNPEYTNLLKNSKYKVPIPNIQNGYYLFVNENTSNDGYYSNFSLYILDLDTGLLYFITYDS
ncbi:hypothetical protein [Clostridium sp. JN-9]|uniref:hypothetical protein n=1 Tax=Clostridium sp. JN-9 TaxID=2507159 RepID=UPI000FFE13F2|nr:hypothetical protein [Clostridium sp. JN-9]QAT40735.1 hypothetical protein EQM05_10950 [Clostridium sp. JN-9]